MNWKTHMSQLFTVPDLDTLTGQVTPHGVLCLMALYLESPLPEERLADICRLSIRTLRERVLPKLELHNYTATNGIGCYITDKAKAIIAHLLATIATVLRIQSPAAADSDTLIATQAELFTGEVMELCARGAHIPHSDQIRSLDHQKDHDYDQGSELIDTLHAADARDGADVLDACEHYGIKDYATEGKNYRAQLMRDPWITGRRIDAAWELAKERTTRNSPAGLAIHMLLKTTKNRAEIERRAIEIEARDDEDSTQ
jgi:hypothetical protein